MPTGKGSVRRLENEFSLQRAVAEAKAVGMSLISEFKTFISRGNVIDLAVGIIIGGAFGTIVTSLVGDIIMPPIGLLTGKVPFPELKLVIGGSPDKPVTINYGSFLQHTVNFLIIAAAVFLIVKFVNAFKKKEEVAPTAPPPPEILLLTEIRDALTNKPPQPGIPSVRS